MDFKAASSAYAERVDALLVQWISQRDLAPRLQEAMRYSVFNGGKRMRPVLVMSAADALSTPNALTLAAAASVECIHAYSLIHDDLPAMDDDALRRGKPTCHIQFDEATAILAGDALQSLAFEGLAKACSDNSGAVDMLTVLAQACGANGMVGGQMLDILAEGKGEVIDLDALKKIHNYKTGALISASVRLGAMSVQANVEQLAALDRYAQCLGLAFQVQDDIIDLTSDTETLGKQQGADIDKNKSTFVSLLGLEASREHASYLIDEAKAALAHFGSNANQLLALADYCISRDR